MECPHLRRGKCNFGLTGRKKVDGKVCPFKHPRVYEALLNHGTNGKLGCKGRNSGCGKFHPKFCNFSLNKGVCYDKDCKRGLHVRGTNTRAARAKAEEGNKEGKQVGEGYRHQSRMDPELPTPRQPGLLPKILGQQQQVQQLPQQQFQQPQQQVQQPQQQSQQQPQQQLPQTADQTAAFLGQLLIQGLFQCLQPKASSPQQEKTPNLNLEQLVKFLSLSQ